MDATIPHSELIIIAELEPIHKKPSAIVNAAVTSEGPMTVRASGHRHSAVNWPLPMRVQFGMQRHPWQSDFDAIACNFIALAIRGNIQSGSQVWLTTYYVDDDGKTLPPVRKDLLATLRIAQPWLTPRELLDSVTSFLAHWIPTTQCVPLAGNGSRNQVALVVDYAIEMVNPPTGNR